MGKRLGGVVGFWNDDHELLEAAKKIKAQGYKKFDTISPFPIHGMDDAMGIGRSHVPWVSLVGGIAGCATGLLFQTYMAAWSWPFNIGGKPLISLPAFIPITFELTVLFSALATVAAVIVMNRLPRIDPPVIDTRLTDDKFALFIPENDTGYEASKAESALKAAGAIEVRKVAEY